MATRTVLRIIRSILLVSSAGGCHSAHLSRPAQPAVTRLTVENGLFDNVVVWVVRGDTPIRIGVVEGFQRRTFTLNRAITAGGSDFALRAESTVSRRLVVSPHFGIDRGRTIEWTLRDGEGTSSLIIRFPWP